ncbi:IpaD/SipD/SspD family type III secretion system needle tip protein [Escherichia albertii]
MMMDINTRTAPPFLQEWLNTQSTQETPEKEVATSEATSEAASTPAAATENLPAATLTRQQISERFLDQLAEYYDQYNQLLQKGITIDTTPAQNLLKKAVPVILGTVSMTVSAQKTTESSASPTPTSTNDTLVSLEVLQSSAPIMLGAGLKASGSASVTFDSSTHTATLTDDSGNTISINPNDMTNPDDNYATVTIDTSKASSGTVKITKNGTTVTLKDDDAPEIAADGTITINDGTVVLTIAPTGRITLADKANTYHIYINNDGVAIQPDSEGKFPETAKVTFDADNHSATIYDDSGNHININPDDMSSSDDNYDSGLTVDTSRASSGVIAITEGKTTVTLTDVDGKPTVAADGTVTIDDGNIVISVDPTGRTTISDKNTTNHLYINAEGKAVQPDSKGQFPQATGVTFNSSTHEATVTDDDCNTIKINPDDVENPTDYFDVVRVNDKVYQTAENTGSITITKGDTTVTLVDDDQQVKNEDGSITINDGNIVVTVSPTGVVKIADDKGKNCIYIGSDGKAVQPDSDGKYPTISDKDIYNNIIDELHFLEDNYMDVWADLASNESDYLEMVNGYKSTLSNLVQNGDSEASNIYLNTGKIESRAQDIIDLYGKDSGKTEYATAIHCETLDQVYYWADQLDLADPPDTDAPDNQNPNDGPDGIVVKPSDGSHPITSIDTSQSSQLDLKKNSDGSYTLYVYVDVKPLEDILYATKNAKTSGSADSDGYIRVDHESYQQWQSAMDTAFTDVENGVQTVSEKLNQANTTFNNLCKIISGAIDTILQTQLEYFK